MAVAFTQSSTDKVTVTDPVTWGAGLAFTIIYIIRQVSNPTVNGIGYGKGANDGLPAYFINWFFEVQRASTRAEALVSNANLFPNSDFFFLALTYDETDGPRIYRGSLDAADAAEPTYVSRVVGSGNTNTDTGDLWIGNRSASGSSSINHELAEYEFHDVRMTQAQLQARQIFRQPASSRKIYFNFTETGTIPDYSGNGNDGTGTGLTLVDHPNIVTPFGNSSNVIPFPVAAGAPGPSLPPTLTMMGVGQ